MENSDNEFFQFQENTQANGESSRGISSYVSCIKIHGKPILPPLISDERRKELDNYKKKAIEIEKRLYDNKQKSLTCVKCNSVSTSESSIANMSPNRQMTPARPVSLQLLQNVPDGTFLLNTSSESKRSKSSSDQDKPKLKIDVNISCDNVSSQKSTIKTKSKSFRSTLEQRLANEEVPMPSKTNLYEQSPIIEENYTSLVTEESDDSKKKERWSPLNIESINSLKVEKSKGDSHNAGNSFVSLDDLENSSETITGSPNLMRQSSYTLLTPSPALLNYMANQKDDDELTKRSQSGRKTWDLTKAKKNWRSNSTEDPAEKYKENSSFDGFQPYGASSLKNGSPGRNLNSYTDDGSTSPSSHSFKGNSPKFQKIKCKIKSRRVKPHKTVPSPKPTDQVPNFGQGPETVFVPLKVKEELNDLSKLLLKMKMEHERQKKELEERQNSEIKELEALFKRREYEFLQRVNQESPCPRSIYSQYSDPIDTKQFNVQMMGDGNHNSLGGKSDELIKRPQSAKFYYSPSCTDQESRRTRSMDFNQETPYQDTDLDVSFQDSLQSKEFYIGTGDIIDTDTVSNCSSHSSTMSSDSKLESMPLLDVKRFRILDMTPEEVKKFNHAADVITAAARGFLTRRLLRTSHVQSLITTLRDAISCATQLHGASDLGESDVDLMKRLGRQIEAAWEAVYAVFFDTDPSTRMQLIAADRERLRSISTKVTSKEPMKRISSATLKSLRRKSGSELFMSKSQISNGSNSGKKARSRMIASYPSPGAHYKLK